MCKLKEGADVKHKGDLQNLITGMILRQTSTFSTEDVYKVVKEKLVGSAYYGSPEVIQRCKDTMSTLFVTDCIRSVGRGKYKLAMSFPAINYIKLDKKSE